MALAEALGIFLLLIILFYIVCIALCIFLVIFWIWMIVDIAKRNFKEPNDKLMWMLVVLIANIIGAVIYYFIVKRKK